MSIFSVSLCTIGEIMIVDHFHCEMRETKWNDKRRDEPIRTAVSSDLFVIQLCIMHSIRLSIQLKYLI